MRVVFRSQLTAGFLALALASFVEAGQFAASSATTVPSELTVPDGNTLFLTGHAEGTQNYVCLSSTTGVRWTFFAPQATLFQQIKLFGFDIKQQIITHFLSPNPAEGGLPRPTWQSSLDTSAVWGQSIASSTDSNYVMPDSIPWLLLKAVGTQRGPLDGRILSSTTFVQRLNTSGGTAPVSGCATTDDSGRTALVPYTADYFFYKAK